MRVVWGTNYDGRSVRSNSHLINQLVHEFLTKGVPHVDKEGPFQVSVIVRYDKQTVESMINFDHQQVGQLDASFRFVREGPFPRCDTVLEITF